MSLETLVSISANTLAPYWQVELESGPHTYIADEPVTDGGGDTGMSPYQLLVGALASCTAITVKMYANKKGWPLDDVEVQIEMKKEIKDAVQITHFERAIELKGNLDNEQKNRLMEIANRCPVHRILNNPIQIHTTEI